MAFQFTVKNTNFFFSLRMFALCATRLYCTRTTSVCACACVRRARARQRIFRNRCVENDFSVASNKREMSVIRSFWHFLGYVIRQIFELIFFSLAFVVAENILNYRIRHFIRLCHAAKLIYAAEFLYATGSPVLNICHFPLHFNWSVAIL